MKKIIFLLSVFFLGCSSDNKYLINEGVVNIDYLFNSPNTEWFKKNYDSYNLDTKTLNYNFSNLDEFQIEIYMNTKCHDSEREVPRLIKILNTLKSQIVFNRFSYQFHTRIEYITNLVGMESFRPVFAVKMAQNGFQYFAFLKPRFWIQ